MLEPIHIGPRSKQVLKALYEHGPLSNATLREVIDPKMCVRSMNYAIKRLNDLGLIKNRHSSITKHSSRFVQLTNNDELKPILAKILNINLDLLKYVHGGTEALEHSQECAVWSNYFKTHFKDIQVIRDFHIARNKTAMETLLVNPDDIDLLPDMILRFPSVGQKGWINVGVEVERTQKAKDRITKKLRKFSSRTRLDSVLYICRNTQIINKITSTYIHSVVPKALRIQHYFKDFLHIAGSLVPNNNQNLFITNVSAETFSLAQWIHFLRTHQMSARGGFCVNAHSTPGM
jgi:hypothetical protein